LVCSWANAVNLSMASRKEPALRTWSQVSVVKLAAKVDASVVEQKMCQCQRTYCRVP